MAGSRLDLIAPEAPALLIGARADSDLSGFDPASTTIVQAMRTDHDALAARGFALVPTLAGVDLDSADGPLGVNLIGDARRREDPQRRYQWLLAAVAVLFTAFALWQIRENRAAAADALERLARCMASPVPALRLPHAQPA